MMAQISIHERTISRKIIPLPLPEEVVEKIDENRDDLCRWEFVELCINEYSKSFMEEELRTAGDKRIIVPLSKKTAALIDRNRGDLCRWDFIKHCIDSMNIKDKETIEWKQERTTEERKPAKLPWKGTFDLLWLGAFLFYGAGDVLSSFLAYNNALVEERNPVLNYLTGGNVYALIPLKIVILLSLFLLSYHYLPNKLTSMFIPSLLILMGIIISIQNILFYI